MDMRFYCVLGVGNLAIAFPSAQTLADCRSSGEFCSTRVYHTSRVVGKAVAGSNGPDHERRQFFHGWGGRVSRICPRHPGLYYHVSAHALRQSFRIVHIQGSK